MDSQPLPGPELAPLPREQVGPFLILGVAKDADAGAIEAHWAQCVLWARQRKTQTPLGDIHWAREVLRDESQRLAADVATLNAETAGEELRRSQRRFRLDSDKLSWTPVDPEPALEASVPDPAVERDRLPAPSVPDELPGVARWLDAFSRDTIDPWSLRGDHE